jgi:hypothetical protein
VNRIYENNVIVIVGNDADDNGVVDDQLTIKSGVGYFF